MLRYVDTCMYTQKDEKKIKNILKMRNIHIKYLYSALMELRRTLCCITEVVHPILDLILQHYLGSRIYFHTSVYFFVVLRSGPMPAFPVPLHVDPGSSCQWEGPLVIPERIQALVISLFLLAIRMRPKKVFMSYSDFNTLKRKRKKKLQLILREIISAKINNLFQTVSGKFLQSVWIFFQLKLHFCWNVLNNISE